MRFMILVLAILLSTGLCGATKIGCMLNETNLAICNANGWDTWAEVSGHAWGFGGPTLGIDEIIAAATPTGTDAWEIDHETKWKRYNGRFWFMAPYPPMKNGWAKDEHVVSHIAIQRGQGEFYLIGASV